ncbi:BcdcL1 [Apiospora kogelbergensis]|uniref:Dicer-like protein 1 n=1 Tax=Apiospora kogelbergensis TaxID=1337665 RepID=A0AAW0QHI5_9PEZI
MDSGQQERKLQIASDSGPLLSVDDDDVASQSSKPHAEDESDPENLSDAETSNEQLEALKRKAMRLTAQQSLNDYKRDQQKQEADIASRAKVDTNGHTASRVIDSPREYQVELFERAKEKNTIAVLSTGSGKTAIAALLLRHTIEQEINDRDNGQAPRTAFFLVDKVSLVAQQSAFLRRNLDYSVGDVSGEQLGSVSTKRDYYQKTLLSKKVVVCTAAIVLDCLHHSYLTIDQINLLIFDEAHHAKKNHPYAVIIKDFYADAERRNSQRPRIFGMTASPVDVKRGDILTGALELEGLLHSEIATVADPGVFREHLQKTNIEKIVEYNLAPAEFETPLWSRLNSLIGHNNHFKKLFDFAKWCTRELGPWCADRVWHICFTEEEAKKARARTQAHFNKKAASIHIADVSLLDNELHLVDLAYETVREHTEKKAQRSYDLVSDKIFNLSTILTKEFTPRSDKCIIFVDRRLTAVLLTDLLTQPGMRLEHVQPRILLGAGSVEAGEQLGMTRKAQEAAIRQFKSVELNCLVATNIAEEGLDIPDCNMVIRFDLYNTMIQYIQSKGRARMENSRFYHMLERDNEDHAQRYVNIKANEKSLGELSAVLPEGRRLVGNDYNMDYYLRKEAKETYKDKETGATLTYKSSLIVLADFVSSLENASENCLHADYVVKSVGKEFQCEVILPDHAPIKTAMGHRAASKQVAKCSAAFKACVRLRKLGFLDQWLQSTFKKYLPKMRNARLAISSKKRHEYPMKMKPDIWSQRGYPTELYVAVLRLTDPHSLGRSSRPLAILTRTKLPLIADFQIFFGNSNSSGVKCVPLERAMTVSPDETTALTTFTLRVFEDVFSKQYKHEPPKLPYYLAPLTQGHDYDVKQALEQIRTLIDWDYIATLQGLQAEDNVTLANEDYRNCFVTDPHDGSRKFYTTGRIEGMKPSDPQLPGAPKGASRTKGRRQAPNDIWNYSISMWSRSRANLERHDDLAVVEAEYIPLRRNLLDEFEKPPDTQNRCYICFQTLKISPLSADIVSMAYNLPAIIYRIDANLIALEACEALGLQIRPDLALEAMTKDSDNTEEHAEQKINFQRGMGNNYERLELLGDSFLKMSTTIALFARKADANEFQYHVDRMVMICNTNLFNHALELRLEESIRSRSFNRRIWYPDGLELLKGKQNESILGRKGMGRGIHVLADKTIADVCEALIGAAYLTTYGQGSMDMAVKAVTKFTSNEQHTMMKFDDFLADFTVPDWQKASPTAVHVRLAQQIEQRLGYRFQYPRLLRSAFTHPSYSFMYENIPHYQRLEFLGDALYDMVCVDYLFHRFISADPQWLTEHKMAMVSNQFLGCLCVSLGLNKHLISMTGGLPQQIADYVGAITDAREAAEAESINSGRPRDSFARNYWVDVSSPPKCLPDIVEAYIGALFVDSGFCYTRVQEFFEREVRPYFEDMEIYDTYANKQPSTALEHKVKNFFGCDQLFVLAMHGDKEEDGGLGEDGFEYGITIHSLTVTTASASSLRYAKVAAAKKALDCIQELDLAQFKRSTFATANGRLLPRRLRRLLLLQLLLVVVVP